MSDPLKRRRRKQQKLRRQRDRHTATGARGPTTPAAAGWPVIKCYVPEPDCFRATGHGTGGIVRQRPDGSLVTAFFHLSLLDGGIVAAFGKDDADLAETLDLLRTLKPNVAPFVEGPAQLLSRYVWGAYAWGLDEDLEWDEPMTTRYLPLVPPLPGKWPWWLKQLAEDERLVFPGLVDVILDNPIPDDLPDDKDTLIWTTATFDVESGPAAVDELRRRDPEFACVEEDNQESVFDWTRKYPKGHWSPLAELGGRQILGSVRVRGRTVVADAKTLSMAATLFDKLKDALGPSLRLTDASWKSSEDLVREARENAGDDDDDPADDDDAGP